MNLKSKMGMDYILTSDRVSDYFRDVKCGEVSCLCNYPEESRQKSLEQVFKLLHQWWVLKLIHETLGAAKIERGWSVTQGELYPVSIFIDEQGNYYTCWFELQRIRQVPPSYKGPLVAFLEGKVAWVRPDLIVSKGKYNSATDVGEFDILVECKNLPFDKWWADGRIIEKQFLPYRALFNPRNTFIASLKPIPNWAKQRMENQGFLVADKVYPGGEGVSKFVELIKQKGRS